MYVYMQFEIFDFMGKGIFFMVGVMCLVLIDKFMKVYVLMSVIVLCLICYFYIVGK